jgi:uncharacterized SAM-binding protein YcdF (DUF218 family)
MTETIVLSKRSLRRAAASAILTLALLITFHPLWLSLVAYALIVDETPQTADAIVVLGGGSGDREVTGARLYAEGYAPVVITTGGVVGLPGLPGVTFAELGANELTRLGVPASAIIQLSDATSTCDDARLALAALPPGARRLLLVTDPFHTRRARWLFARGAERVEVITVAASPSWFDPAQWWQDDRGIIVVGQEYVKFAVTLVNGCG